MRRLFEPLNVTFCNAGELQWNNGEIGARKAHGFKPYCLMHSRFREILFIDADNGVFRNPEFLFETPEYLSTRALFWQDRPDWSRKDGAHATGMPELRVDFGMNDSGGIEFETGQIVLNKEACWQALSLTLHLNRHNEYYYQYLYGDKETFHLAFDFSDTPYTVIAKPPAWRKAQIGQELMQFGLDGEPLFLHRAGLTKFRIGRPVPAYHRIPNLPQTYVRQILKTLRGRYHEIFSRRMRIEQYLSGWYWTAPPWGKEIMLKGRALLGKTYRSTKTP